jgi:hypothetical protein
VPSSISSFSLAPGGSSVAAAEAPRPCDRYVKASVVSLICFGLLVGSLELGARVAFDRVSHIGKRIAGEYSLAQSLTPDKPVPGRRRDSPSILILGNSLLLMAVDLPALQQKVAPNSVRVSRFVIESTAWLDWYYGIRRLLANGSRPDVIILCLDARQLMSPSIRGDYSSYYLFQVRDILAVARATHSNLTQTSSLILAHYSRFYADRDNLRGFLLNRLDPEYMEMMQEVTVWGGALPSGAEIERTAEARLAALIEATAPFGVKSILLIPPGSIAGGKEISTAATRVGAEVWVPIPQGTLPTADFQEDGYHLNQRGATIFTPALAGEMNRLAVSLIAPAK